MSWSLELELELEEGVRGQESVRSSWSLELELESGIDILFIRNFNTEAQRHRDTEGFKLPSAEVRGSGVITPVLNFSVPLSLCVSVLNTPVH